MHCFPMSVSQSLHSKFAVKTLGYPPKMLGFGVPQAAERVLDPILEPYDQNSYWYFYRVYGWETLSPWAFVCLDREYALAGHVADARPADAGLFFAPYRYTRFGAVPEPTVADYVPQVGVIIVSRKEGLRVAASRSPIFDAAWRALRCCDARRHWLVVLDPLPEEWLNAALPGDAARWLSRLADPETVAGRYKMKWGHSNAKLSSDLFPPPDEGWERVSSERSVF